MNFSREVEVTTYADADIDLTVEEIYDAMDNEERNEMAALLVGTIMAQRPDGWLAVQVELECANQKLPPYTREYLEQTTGRPIGLI